MSAPDPAGWMPDINRQTKRSRREFRLDTEEMALIMLAGEVYNSDSQFLQKYGYDAKEWPHRSILINLNAYLTHPKFKWATWDKKQGWVRW